MTYTGGPGSVSPRPEWRATLAAALALLLILCLCVMVVGVRRQGGGIAGAMLRWLAEVPLLGRLVEPLLRNATTPDAPVLELAAPREAAPPAPTAADPADYLVRPSNWPKDWPWPPRPLDQPAAAPQAQPTEAPAVQPTAAPVIQPTAAPAQEPTLSPEEEQELLGNPEEGPVG